MDGMEAIESNIMDKVLSHIAVYNYQKYKGGMSKERLSKIIYRLRIMQPFYLLRLCLF
jgi:hypothetical protein